MQLNVNDVIDTNNASYLVTCKVKYDGIYYYSIANIYDKSEIKFVSIEDDEMVILKDTKILNNILKLVVINISKEFNI